LILGVRCRVSGVSVLAAGFWLLAGTAKIHSHGSRIRQCRNSYLFALMAAAFLYPPQRNLW
jgi:hypothetical protein